jgi:hypothetical protein
MDEAAPLLDDSQAKEARVAEAAEAALAHTEDAGLRSWLEDLRHDASTRVAELRSRSREA